jgi:hypothetical protein
MEEGAGGVRDGWKVVAWGPVRARNSDGMESFRSHRSSPSLLDTGEKRKREEQRDSRNREEVYEKAL